MACSGGAAADELRRRGLRCTPQRRAVLQVLEESPYHLSAAEVHERVRAREPDTGLATIYRSLDLLADMGLIVRLHLEDGCHRYVAASRGHRHQLICRQCGRVVELADCVLAGATQQLEQQTAFHIEGHWLQFFGRCQSCAEKQENQEVQ